MRTTAAKLNLGLGMVLVVGAGLMLVFDAGSSAAALLVIGICNLVIGWSVKKESSS